MQSELKSTIRARYLVIQDNLNGGHLSISPGIDRLWVEKSGSFTFRPYEQFQIDELYIDGVFTSLTPLTLEGKALVKSNQLYIGNGGSITLDSTVQATRTWTGTSRMGVHNLAIHGTLKAGRLMNHLNSTQGWDSLLVSATGVLEFTSEDIFYVNHLQIDGRMTVWNPIHMLSFVPNKDLEFYIGGTVVLDAQASHHVGPWTGKSNITADVFKMATSSRFDAGNMDWSVKQLEIGGTLKSQTATEVKVISFKVTSTGVATFFVNIAMKAADLQIDNGGVMDLDFR